MSEADAEDGLQGLDAYHSGMNEGTTLDFAFHSDRFLFPYRKPAPPFCHPIPIQPPPRKKYNWVQCFVFARTLCESKLSHALLARRNKNGEGAKGEGGTPRVLPRS